MGHLTAKLARYEQRESLGDTPFDNTTAYSPPTSSQRSGADCYSLLSPPHRFDDGGNTSRHRTMGSDELKRRSKTPWGCIGWALLPRTLAMVALPALCASVCCASPGGWPRDWAR